MGDGNNIVHSWLRLAAVFKMDFICACPKGGWVGGCLGAWVGAHSWLHCPLARQAVTWFAAPCTALASSADVCVGSPSLSAGFEPDKATVALAQAAGVSKITIR